MRIKRLTATVAITVFLGAGVVSATIPDGDGTIHGCFARSGGSLRVIDATVTNCKSGETGLTRRLPAAHEAGWPRPPDQCRSIRPPPVRRMSNRLESVAGPAAPAGSADAARLITAYEVGRSELRAAAVSAAASSRRRRRIISAARASSCDTTANPKASPGPSSPITLRSTDATTAMTG